MTRSSEAMPRVAAAFRKLVDSGAKRWPELLDVGLRLDPDLEAYSTRSRAACSMEPPVEVLVAPILEYELARRIQGVLRHELGHAIHALVGRRGIRSRIGGLRLPKSDERLADDLGFYVWGQRINYEPPLYIQTIGPGVHPRPAALPQ